MRDSGAKSRWNSGVMGLAGPVEEEFWEVEEALEEVPDELWAEESEEDSSEDSAEDSSLGSSSLLSEVADSVREEDAGAEDRHSEEAEGEIAKEQPLRHSATTEKTSNRCFICLL